MNKITGAEKESALQSINRNELLHIYYCITTEMFNTTNDIQLNKTHYIYIHI